MDPVTLFVDALAVGAGLTFGVGSATVVISLVDRTYHELRNDEGDA